MKIVIKMKKALSILVLASVIAPLAALAQAPATGCNISHTLGVTGCPPSGSSCVFTDLVTYPMCGMCCILDAVHTVTDWIFYGLMVVVGLLVVWGGFTIATAGGDPAKVGAGRSSILYAMIGLAVALLSQAIPAVVTALVS